MTSSTDKTIYVCITDHGKNIHLATKFFLLKLPLLLVHLNHGEDPQPHYLEEKRAVFKILLDTSTCFLVKKKVVLASLLLVDLLLRPIALRMMRLEMEVCSKKIEAISFSLYSSSKILAPASRKQFLLEERGRGEESENTVIYFLIMIKLVERYCCFVVFFSLIVVVAYAIHKIHSVMFMYIYIYIYIYWLLSSYVSLIFIYMLCKSGC